MDETLDTLNDVVEDTKKTDKSKLTAFYKVNDIYSRHNFGTRLTLLTFLIMYILVVFSCLDLINTPKAVVDGVLIQPNISEGILTLVKMTGYLSFAAFVVVTLGDNALTKVGDIIVGVKKLKTGGN